ncbi:MAG: ABC transporter ATP-binding protein [Roseovarius sp.]
MSAAPAFEARNLVIETEGPCPPARIVKDVSFSVRRGEVVALIGESGSGKTTLALSTLGYTKPGLRIASGELTLAGESILRMAPLALRDLRGRRVAYLAQSAAAAFNPAMTVGEQVLETSLLAGVLTPEEARARAVELFRGLDLPEPQTIGQRYPHQLSGGQLQRLMAAMALMCRPDLLVLDEPTTALDVTTQLGVLRSFRNQIRQEGTSAIYVSHDLAVVAQVADRVVVLYGGEVMEEGPIGQILSAPRHEYTRRLIAAASSTLVAGAPPDEGTDNKRAQVALHADIRSAAYGGRGLGRRGKEVLSEVRLDIRDREILGVIGESGSGKSTLARVVAGLLPPSSGEVLLGEDVLPGAMEARARDSQRAIQFVFQMADTALNPKQKIREIIGRPLAFYGGLTGRARDERLKEILASVELPEEFAERYPSELSGGQKQRVNLARALAANPKVLLCDEVTSALDTIVAANITELLRNLKDRFGVSILFITHDISRVASLADRLVVMYSGRVVEQGRCADVLARPGHPYSQLLISSVPAMDPRWLETQDVSIDEAEAAVSAARFSGRGCPFAGRCRHTIEPLCREVAPPLVRFGAEHEAYCHLGEAARDHIEEKGDRNQR